MVNLNLELSSEIFEDSEGEYARVCLNGTLVTKLYGYTAEQASERVIETLAILIGDFDSNRSWNGE